MKHIYLIGGMMNNDNYGDLIQAKTWIDWYGKEHLRVSFICNRHLFPKASSELGLSVDQLVDTGEFISSGNHKGDYMHIYGGGYLNHLWAHTFIDVFKKALQYGMGLYATGVQIDREYWKMARDLDINYISVRGSISHEIVGDAIINDDSFGYFFDRQKIWKTHQNDRLGQKNSVFLQLSLNKYMHEEDKLGEASETYLQLLHDFQESGYKITLASSFPRDVLGINESETLLETLNPERLDKESISYMTTRELDETDSCEFRIFITNSFHTYLLSLIKYRMPVFFLAFNEFYRQKARGLLDYGLLDESRLITNYNHLRAGKLLTGAHGRIDIQKALENNFETHEAVRDKIRKTYIIRK